MLWAADPVHRALSEGWMTWSSIPGILDVKKTAPRVPPKAVIHTTDEVEGAYTPPCTPPGAPNFEPHAFHVPRNVCSEPAPQKHVAWADKPVVANTIKTLIIRNLPRDITMGDIRGAFEKYGPITDVYIPKNMDRNSQYFGTIKGFALVKFLSAADSAKAQAAEYGRLKFGVKNAAVEFAKEDR